ncbi:retrovirus-related pol polyprotein from transposon TNT 1-94 [Tanacetum coccineum]
MKNNTVCKEKASNVFRKEREQYHEIQDLKAQMQDKNMVINELKKLILVTKGKSVETQFDKPSVVRQPNAQRIPKPSVLGKPTPFSNSPEMRSFQTNKSVNKTNASDGLFKPVTQQNLPRNRNQAVRNTNVLKPGMFRIASTTTQTRTPQLPHASRNTNPHMSKSSGVIHTTSVSRPQLKCDQGNDLLTGSRGSDLYTISLQETTSSTPIVSWLKASPTSSVSCEMSKAKRSSFKTKAVPSSKGRLNLLHMDLCGPMRVASINGKKYILDETPKVLKDFLTMIQRNLQAQVITVRTDRGTEFLNKTLHAYFKEEGIEHQTSTPRTPEQNGVVERRNRTLVEAARTMLSASKLPLSFWAEAVATACYTQNRSIIISTHGKTAYHIIKPTEPSIKHHRHFGCICYITRDGENLDKMKEKRGSMCHGGIFYSVEGISSRKTLHHNDMNVRVENVASGLVPQGQKASDYDNSDPVPPRQNVVPSAEKTDSSQQGLEFLFSPLLEEYYNPTHGQAEENNNDQAHECIISEAEFTMLFVHGYKKLGVFHNATVIIPMCAYIFFHPQIPDTDGPEIIH